MTFRARLILACIPVALVPLAALAFGIRREVDARVREQFAARVEGLAAGVTEDLERESDAVHARLTSLARTLAEDNRLRVALLADPGERRFLLDYAHGAMALSGLDVLQIQDESGRILSSGHFRNDFDRVDAALVSGLRSLGERAALAEVRGTGGPFLALLRAAEVRIGPRRLTLVGGRTVDNAFLARLERGSGLSLTLERPGAPSAHAAQSGAAAIVRTVEVPFIADDAAGGGARFLITHSLAPLEALRRGIARWFLLATMGAALLALGLALRVASGISRPVTELAARTRRLDLDRLDGEFGRQRTDELGVLEGTLGELTQRLRASATRLREAERRATVGEIARQVNHDVRNGLVPIRNVVQHLAQLARENPAEMPAVFLERQATLDGSITYLQALATHYARLSPALERRPCDLNEIVREVLPGAVRDRVRVRAELAAGLPVVMADPVALRRIMENLIANAIESLPARGGEVVVSTRAFDVHGEQRIEAVVADTGHGMSADELARIFDDFYTTKERGTGLGLSIVRRLAADLGGSVRVQSEPGRGSCFVVELPAGRAD